MILPLQRMLREEATTRATGWNFNAVKEANVKRFQTVWSHLWHSGEIRQQRQWWPGVSSGGEESWLKSGQQEGVCFMVRELFCVLIETHLWLHVFRENREMHPASIKANCTLYKLKVNLKIIHTALSFLKCGSGDYGIVPGKYTVLSSLKLLYVSSNPVI